MNIFADITQAARRWRELRRMPLRLEFVVTDHCNLNCRGCTHYSPLADEEFVDSELLERSIRHLGHTCGMQTDSVYIIGGEPLLYPGLRNAMRAMAEAFPTSRKYIFTNGLAVRAMSDDFYREMVASDFTMAMTRYPVSYDYDAAIAWCRSKGANVEVFADRSAPNTFFRFPLDPNKRQNGHISHFKCYNIGCTSVIGDKIYPCSISGCVAHLNKAFGTRFEHTEGDWLNVFDVRSATEIKHLISRPVPFCSYCIQPPIARPHALSERRADEWIEK